MNFFKEHPAVAITLFIGTISVMGMLSDFILLTSFKINYFNYADIDDFLMGAGKILSIISEEFSTFFFVFVVMALIAVLLIFMQNWFNSLSKRREIHYLKKELNIQNINVGETFYQLNENDQIGHLQSLLGHLDEGRRRSLSILGLNNIISLFCAMVIFLAIYITYTSLSQEILRIKTQQGASFDVRVKSTRGQELVYKGINLITATNSSFFYYQRIDAADETFQRVIIVPTNNLIVTEKPLH